MRGTSASIRRYELPAQGAVAETLFRRGWLPEQPRAAVLIVHGFAEHSGRYEHVGRILAEQGFAVHAYDHLGHGRSSGPRCHVRRFDDYLDDLATMLEFVERDAEGLPVFLVGHSMGGLIVASFASERAPRVAGIALSGAALALGPGAPRAQLWLARAIRAIAPRFVLPSTLDAEGLCTDPAVVEAYLADPLVERRMTASLAVEIFDAIGRTAARGAEVRVPLLALHGGDDPTCAPEGSEAFAAAAPQGRFVRYPGLRHEIFNEPSHAAVLADLVAWIEEVLGAGGRA